MLEMCEISEAERPVLREMADAMRTSDSMLSQASIVSLLEEHGIGDTIQRPERDPRADSVTDYCRVKKR